MMALINCPTYTLEMCMVRKRCKIKHPLFLYKFTDQDNAVKCYKFKLRKLSNKLRYTNKDFPLLCSGCEMSYLRSRDTGVPFEHSLKTRRTDGLKLLSNPHAGHVPGCVPMDYEMVILNTPPVTDIVKEKIIRGEDISMHLRPPGLLFSCPDAPMIAGPTDEAPDPEEGNGIYGTNSMKSQSLKRGNTNRKTTSSDHSCTSLVHEFDIPDYVDRDSLPTS